MQRQTPRRDNFQLYARPLFSTDPEFENVADLVPIMKFVPLPLIIGLSIRSRRHAINSITRAETHHGISLSRDRRFNASECSSKKSEFAIGRVRVSAATGNCSGGLQFIENRLIDRGI